MIPLVKVNIAPRERVMKAIEDALYSGMIAEGEHVYNFERKFADHFGIQNALAMSSGTAALHTALRLAGVTPDCEVISTPMTAEPTNASILHCGAKVVWADVDPDTGNIDPDSVKRVLSPKTKAIVCVHYAGYPARLAELRAIADTQGISLIEDCAHALGAEYRGKPIGTIGDFAIFSFQAIKHMTTVDGGMLIIKDPGRCEEAKRFRWFGMLKGEDRRCLDIRDIGYKYNMNNVTAAIGEVQLDYIDSAISRHRANGLYFDEALGSEQGISFASTDKDSKSTYWLYTLLSDRSEEIGNKLKEHGISASKLHRPNNRHSIFTESQRDLPGLDLFYERLLHIPCGWWVTDEERGMIVDILANAIR